MWDFQKACRKAVFLAEYTFWPLFSYADLCGIFKKHVEKLCFELFLTVCEKPTFEYTFWPLFNRFVMTIVVTLLSNFWYGMNSCVFGSIVLLTVGLWQIKAIFDGIGVTSDSVRCYKAFVVAWLSTTF